MSLWWVVLISWAQQYVRQRTTEEPDVNHEQPCWLWTGSNDGRYGHAYLCGQRIKAHVLSFLAFGGSLKRHHVVDHICNNTKCCQPAHLRAVTQSENMRRCFAEGRGRSPFVSGDQQ